MDAIKAHQLRWWWSKMERLHQSKYAVFEQVRLSLGDNFQILPHLAYIYQQSGRLGGLIGRCSSIHGVHSMKVAEHNAWRSGTAGTESAWYRWPMGASPTRCIYTENINVVERMTWLAIASKLPHKYSVMVWWRTMQCRPVLAHHWAITKYLFG